MIKGKTTNLTLLPQLFTFNYLTMESYKSFPLGDAIVRFNQVLPECETIEQIEKEHNVSLIPLIRLMPLDSGELVNPTTIGGVQTRIVYSLEILKASPLNHLVKQELLSRVKSLVFVDSFSGIQ